MKISIGKLSALGLGMLSAIALVGSVWAACDGKGASASVGACEDEAVTCGSYTDTGQESCEKTVESPSGGSSAHPEAKEVNEDFPTGCPDKPNYNCNEPLENCSRRTVCEWKDGICQVKPGENSFPWGQKKKRTEVSCQIE